MLFASGSFREILAACKTMKFEKGPYVQVLICLQSMSEIIEEADVMDMQRLQMQRQLTTFEDILGGTPEHNARAFTALLDGAPGGYRDAVLLNAAAALRVAGKVTDLQDGVALARTSIDSGAAKAKIIAVAEITHAS